MFILVTGNKQEVRTKPVLTSAERADLDGGAALLARAHVTAVQQQHARLKIDQSQSSFSRPITVKFKQTMTTTTMTP